MSWLYTTADVDAHWLGQSTYWSGIDFPFSWACWVYIPTGNLGVTQVMMSISDFDAVSNVPRFDLRLNTSNQVEMAYDTASANFNAASTATVSADTWTHVAAVSSASNSHQLYINGSADGSSTTDLVSFGTSIDLLSFGVLLIDAGGFNWLDGNIAECAFWNNRTLTAGEVASLANGASPLFYPDSCIMYTKMFPTLFEHFSWKTSFSSNGTPIWEAEHPNVFYPGHVQYEPAPPNSFLVPHPAQRLTMLRR